MNVYPAFAIPPKLYRARGAQGRNSCFEGGGGYISTSVLGAPPPPPRPQAAA